MAKCNPFAERTGMTKIAEQPPAKKALEIAEALQKLGFNITFLGSKRYVLKKLAKLAKIVGLLLQTKVYLFWATRFISQ